MRKALTWTALAIGVFLITGQLTKTVESKRMSSCKTLAAKHADELGTRQNNIDRYCKLSPWAYLPLNRHAKPKAENTIGTSTAFRS